MKLLLLFGGGGVVVLQLQSSYFCRYFCFYFLFYFWGFFGCLHLQRGKKTKFFFYCWIRFDCLKLIQCWSEPLWSFIQPCFSILSLTHNFFYEPFLLRMDQRVEQSPNAQRGFRVQAPLVSPCVYFYFFWSLNSSIHSFPGVPRWNSCWMWCFLWEILEFWEHVSVEIE